MLLSFGGSGVSRAVVLGFWNSTEATEERELAMNAKTCEEKQLKAEGSFQRVKRAVSGASSETRVARCARRLPEFRVTPQQPGNP